MKAYRRDNPDRPTAYLDAGRAFPFRSTEADVVVPYMVRSFEMLGLDAMNVAEDELSAGISPFQGTARAAAWASVSANFVNLDTGSPCFKPYAIVTPRVGNSRAAGPRIAVIGLSQPERYRIVDGPGGAKFHFIDINKALDAWLPKARAEADLVAVLGNFGLGTGQGLASRFPDLDLVVCATAHGTSVNTADAGNALVVQTGDLGKYGVRIDLYRQPGPRRWKAIPLVTAFGDSVPVDSEASKVLESLRLDLEARTRARAEGVRKNPSARDYAGAAACLPCHAGAARAWNASAHSHAWATLEKASQTLNPLCLQCHTVAYLKPNGFIWSGTHPHLTAVGCEACHGPGADHVANPTNVRMGPTSGETTCRGCHTPGQTPDFDFATFWERIKHR